MEPLTFDQFMAREGLGSDNEVQMHIHAGMRSAPDTKTYKRWFAARLAELQSNRDAERALAFRMYCQGLDDGRYRQPTHQEKLIDTAKGHPHNLSVQAARRLLMKRYGIDYRSL